MPPAATACAVEVRFASYAMGIDRDAAAAVERVLAADPQVVAVTREGGGREGEYALCAATRSRAGAARLFRQIRAVLPDRPRGPIELSAGRRHYFVPVPARPSAQRREQR